MKLKDRPYLREISLKRDEIENPKVYPFNVASIHKLKQIEFHPDVTFIIGENGCGKSTLLEAIAAAWGFNPEGGSINFRFSTRESHSELYKYLRLVRSTTRPRDGFFLRAESFFNVATNIEQMDKESSGGAPIISSYGGRSLHEQSHGESFMALLVNRLYGNGLYIFDEPEAALSPSRQMAALRRIHQLVQNNSQFIMATHSPILMAYPNAKLLLLNAKGFSEIRYEETEYYCVMKRFLTDRERVISELLDGD
jgi:predicted ATPase